MIFSLFIRQDYENNSFIFFINFTFYQFQKKIEIKRKVSKQIKAIFDIENFELSNINIDNTVKERNLG